ncbi:MAG: bacteriohemerythrin [Alphaproteobacteria bacterium]
MQDAPRFAWLPEYELGDSFIDEQHRNIFKLAHILEMGVNNGLGSVVAGVAVVALEEYVVHHFQDELEYFRRIGSPMGSQHAKEHKTLAAEVALMVKDQELGFVPVAEKLMDWLETRLIPHIIYDDRAAVESVQGRASKV